MSTAIGEDFQSVLGAAQLGAEWALSCLFCDLNPSLVRFLVSRAGDAGEDTAQETWLAAASGLRGFRGDERAFRAWVFTIAHRRLVQLWRDQGRRPATPMDPDDLPGMADPFDTATAVVADAAAAELVAGLTPEHAEVILLRVVGGFDAEEVGTIVGRSAGAVRVIQHRALRQLNEKFSKVVTP